MLSKISQVISNNAPIPSQYYHCILQNNPKNQKSHPPKWREKKNYRTLPSSSYPRPFAYFLFSFSLIVLLYYFPPSPLTYVPKIKKKIELPSSPFYPYINTLLSTHIYFYLKRKEEGEKYNNKKLLLLLTTTF